MSFGRPEAPACCAASFGSPSQAAATSAAGALALASARTLSLCGAASSNQSRERVRRRGGGRWPQPAAARRCTRSPGAHAGCAHAGLQRRLAPRATQRRERPSFLTPSMLLCCTFRHLVAAVRELGGGGAHLKAQRSSNTACMASSLAATAGSAKPRKSPGAGARPNTAWEGTHGGLWLVSSTRRHGSWKGHCLPIRSTAQRRAARHSAARRGAPDRIRVTKAAAARSRKGCGMGPAGGQGRGRAVPGWAGWQAAGMRTG